MANTQVRFRDTFIKDTRILIFKEFQDGASTRSYKLVLRDNKVQKLEVFEGSEILGLYVRNMNGLFGCNYSDNLVVMDGISEIEKGQEKKLHDDEWFFMIRTKAPKKKNHIVEFKDGCIFDANRRCLLILTKDDKRAEFSIGPEKLRYWGGVEIIGGNDVNTSKQALTCYKQANRDR